MDYSNEEWIKVYVRDTASWRCTSLGARGLALELSRKMGRFCEEISLGARGLRAVAALVGAPWDEVRPLIEELMADGRLVYDQERQALIDPDHLARQRAIASTAQRVRDHRKSAKAAASNAMSRSVTSCNDQREDREEIRERETRAPEGDPTEPDPATRPPTKTSTIGGERGTDASNVVEKEEAHPKKPVKPMEIAAGIPSLGLPLPDLMRERADGLAVLSGAPELDVQASWTSYVSWCVEQRRPIDEARWTRWVNDDCSKLKSRRVRERERDLSGPRLVVAKAPDTPPAPYHATTKHAPYASERIAPEAARADLRRLGLA